VEIDGKKRSAGFICDYIICGLIDITETLLTIELTEIDVCSLKTLCRPSLSALTRFSLDSLITNLTVESVWYSL